MLRTLRSVVTLGSLLLFIAACANPPRCTDPSTPAPTLDREAERRAVYAAVLLATYRPPDTKRLVIDPQRGRSNWIEGEDIRSRLPDARADTIADYQARTTVGVMPRDIDVSLPIDWFGGDMDALLPQPPSAPVRAEDRWQAFHRRFPGSSGWIRLSDVGFSPDGREALLYAWRGEASLTSVGFLVLLESDGRAWRVRRQALLMRS